MQEDEVCTLAFYVCSWLSRELCESPTQLPKMLTRLVIVRGLTFWLSTPPESHSWLTSESHSWLTAPLLRTVWFGVSLLTDRSGVSLLTDSLHPSSGLVGFCEHDSLCGLRAKINKERFFGHSGTASKMPEIRSPFGRTHTHTHTHTHARARTRIYIYIYIY